MVAVTDSVLEETSAATEITEEKGINLSFLNFLFFNLKFREF